MNYFSQIDQGQAIVANKGVYRQVPIFSRYHKDRGLEIYARWGGGFIRLLKGGGTTHPTAKWYEIDAGDGAFVEENNCVLLRLPVPGARQIDGEAAEVAAE